MKKERKNLTKNTENYIKKSRKKKEKKRKTTTTNITKTGKQITKPILVSIIKNGMKITKKKEQKKLIVAYAVQQ